MPARSFISPKIIYINNLMLEVNMLTDEIYESLMDDEYLSGQEASLKLIKRLEDVIQTLDRG